MKGIPLYKFEKCNALFHSHDQRSFELLIFRWYLLQIFSFNELLNRIGEQELNRCRDGSRNWVLLPPFLPGNFLIVNNQTLSFFPRITTETYWRLSLWIYKAVGELTCRETLSLQKPDAGYAVQPRRGNPKNPQHQTPPNTIAVINPQWFRAWWLERVDGKTLETISSGYTNRLEVAMSWNDVEEDIRKSHIVVSDSETLQSQTQADSLQRPFRQWEAFCNHTDFVSLLWRCNVRTVAAASYCVLRPW